jgi:hypothetical protein
VDGAALELVDAVDRDALVLGRTGFDECCALDDAERVGRLRVDAGALDGALCFELLLCDAELAAVTGTAAAVFDRLECAPLLGALVLVTGAVVPPPAGAAPCGDGFRIRIAAVAITARKATAATAMPTPRCRRGSGSGSAVAGARYAGPAPLLPSSANAYEGAAKAAPAGTATVGRPAAARAGEVDVRRLSATSAALGRWAGSY